MSKSAHQYVERVTESVADERLLGNRFIQALYSPKLENAPLLWKVASSRYLSEVLGYLNYDNALSARMSGMRRFLQRCGVDASELVDDPVTLDTLRKVFERKIRYWECRPLPWMDRSVVCPADSRVMLGSLRESSMLFLKGKFFEFPELLGGKGSRWAARFADGCFAVFRLTPERYHYTHVPAAGRVADFYSVSGRYHSCNPNAAVQLLTPYSKNRRVVTVIDTDWDGGEQIGYVAMIEVVALMVGQIEQRYSEERYEDPQPMRRGMLLQKGAAKALFRPGSSTVVLLFQPGRISFAGDLVRNQQRPGVRSQYAEKFGLPVIETDVRVRTLLAHAAEVQS
jgi:phosphatidylserine decarboxylase